MKTRVFAFEFSITVDADHAWKLADGTYVNASAFSVDASAVRWIGLARLADLTMERAKVRSAGCATVLDLGVL